MKYSSFLQAFRLLLPGLRVAQEDVLHADLLLLGAGPLGTALVVVVALFVFLFAPVRIRAFGGELAAGRVGGEAVAAL